MKWFDAVDRIHYEIKPGGIGDREHRLHLAGASRWDNPAQLDGYSGVRENYGDWSQREEVMARRIDEQDLLLADKEALIARLVDEIHDLRG